GPRARRSVRRTGRTFIQFLDMRYATLFAWAGSCIWRRLKRRPDQAAVTKKLNRPLTDALGVVRSAARAAAQTRLASDLPGREPGCHPGRWRTGRGCRKLTEF